jgi:hypothetical protein
MFASERTMHSITKESNVAICPWFSHTRWSIIQISLLNFMFFGDCKDVMNLARPSCEKILQVLGRSVRLWIIDRARRTRQEGIPLVSSFPNVSNYEILARADINLQQVPVDMGS